MWKMEDRRNIAGPETYCVLREPQGVTYTIKTFGTSGFEYQ